MPRNRSDNHHAGKRTNLQQWTIWQSGADMPDKRWGTPRAIRERKLSLPTFQFTADADLETLVGQQRKGYLLEQADSCKACERSCKRKTSDPTWRHTIGSLLYAKTGKQMRADRSCGSKCLEWERNFSNALEQQKPVARCCKLRLATGRKNTHLQKATTHSTPKACKAVLQMKTRG
jgi:hypothetical protein